MFYPQEVIREVVALNDIVDVVSGYVSLSPRSANLFGLCPFHGEDTASFSVSPEKQIFYCFGCHASGNAVTFVMKIENMDFVGALKILADRVHYKLPEREESATAKEQHAMRELSAELNKRAARFYHDFLFSDAPEAVDARNYLDARGVHPALVKRFGIGMSPPLWDGLLKHLKDAKQEHVAAAGLAKQSKKDASRYYDRFRYRLMFPIIDQRNRVIGFGGRIMDPNDTEGAKYLNSQETNLFHKSDNLYGLNLARKERNTELIVVEGYMDVLAMHQWGFANTVGVLGTALNSSHAKLLKSAGCTSVVLMLDGDAAGVRATLRAIPVLTKAGFRVKTLDISEADSEVKDPDEYLQKHGAAPLATLIKNAKSHIAYQVELYKQKHDMTTTEGRVAFTHDAAELLATLPSAIETDAYIAEISKISDISQSAILAEVNKQKGAAPTVTTPLRRRVQAKVQGGGVQKAKRTLLHLVLTFHIAAKALETSRYIVPEELGGIYGDLLTLAFENAQNGRKMNPAEIISHFQNGDVHRAIAEIFVEPPEYSNKAAVEKAVNETAFIIKKSLAQEQMRTETDPRTLQTLGSLVRNMPQIGIQQP